VSALYEAGELPELRDPVLVVGLEGWIDAGIGAAGAASALLEQLDTSVVASFDTDQLIDYRSRRPLMHLADGINTGLTWPGIELLAASPPGAGPDVLLLVGPEPDLRWRAFTAEVVDLAARLGTKLVVGFGAYPAPAPHTRPVRIATTATTADLVDRVAEVRARLDVPAGVMAAIERRCAESGIPAVGIWAQVPHYAAAMPYPPASARLLQTLSELSGLELDLRRLDEAGAAARSRLEALISNSAEHQELVVKLETAFDSEDHGQASAGAEMEMASGDELAAELERFLRNREGGDAGPS
jgi:proteasome assembly chaperone (PAC2) family protein